MKTRAFVTDFIFILLFVAIGRDAHKHKLSLGGISSTTWPFVIGLVSGWLLLVLTHRPASTKTSGLIIVFCTVTIGMILRVISGQGTALTFIIVAFVFFTLFLLGWRTFLWLPKNKRRVAL